MGLLDAYQDSTDTALRVMGSRPPEPDAPAPKHSAWTTIPRAVAAAASEVAGGIIDTASAYGQVSAAMGQNSLATVPDSADTRRQRLDAFDTLKAEGIDWQPEESRPHYAMARELRPDPLTAGTAENIVFGLTKGLSKAIGAGMVIGPVAGASLFGASEGMATAEDLAAQGVDRTTRTKAGAVVGGFSAAGMALPVAGSTLGQTAALVAIGGPGAFMAQQAATRAILEGADYGRIAQQFDPLDPVGLTLATLLPAGFAGWAKAGAIKAAAGKIGKAGDSSAPRSAEPIAATPDAVNAAMVHNITTHADSRLARESAELLRAWDEVHRNPLGPPDDPLVRLTPETIGEVIVQRGDAWLGKDGVTIQTGREGHVKVIVERGPESVDRYPVTRDDVTSLPITLRQYEPLMEKGSAGKTEATWAIDRGEGIPPLVVVVKEATRDGKNRLITMYSDERTPARPRSEKREGSITGGSAPSLASHTARDTVQEPLSSSPGSPMKSLDQTIAKGQGDPIIASLFNRVEALRAQNPDMPVALRDDGTHARLADEIEALRRDAREGTDTAFGADDAPLIQVAAECALAMGMMA